MLSVGAGAGVSNSLRKTQSSSKQLRRTPLEVLARRLRRNRRRAVLLSAGRACIILLAHVERCALPVISDALAADSRSLGDRSWKGPFPGDPIGIRPAGRSSACGGSGRGFRGGRRFFGVHVRDAVGDLLVQVGKVRRVATDRGCVVVNLSCLRIPRPVGRGSATKVLIPGDLSAGPPWRTARAHPRVENRSSEFAAQKRGTARRSARTPTRR